MTTTTAVDYDEGFPLAAELEALTDEIREVGIRPLIADGRHRQALNNNQRSVLAALLADRLASRRPDGAANNKLLQRMLGVSIGSMHRAKTAMHHGCPELRNLTAKGRVPLTTAARVARLDLDSQMSFIEQVHAGEEPRYLSRPGYFGNDPAASRLTQREARYRYVQQSTLQVLGDSFDALALVLATAEGLDPAMTPSEAAHWRGDLTRRARSVRHLMNLLKERSA
jgi:hypothetical protein